MNDVTRRLQEATDNDPEVAMEILPLVYDELRRLANVKLSHEKVGQTLGATALVHEAFLKLVNAKTLIRWQSRRHFFAAAAEAMRRILIDIARRKSRLKHGGQRVRVDLDPALLETISSDQWETEMLDLDEVLTKFEADYPEEASLVKLRYFAGLTMQEAAESMGISQRTAQRKWQFAKAWLYHQLNELR